MNLIFLSPMRQSFYLRDTIKDFIGRGCVKNQVKNLGPRIRRVVDSVERKLKGPLQAGGCG